MSKDLFLHMQCMFLVCILYWCRKNGCLKY